MDVALLLGEGSRATHRGGKGGRWRGRSNSRGKNLEHDWSQFLLPPHQSWLTRREVGAEPDLPASLASFPVSVVQHVLESRADILEAAMGWRGEICTAHTGSVGGGDVPEVVVHPDTEGEHGLAHVVLVASGALNGIDEVV